MTDRILVAYATKYGGTEEIAQKIGDILIEAGLSTEVLPVKTVKDLSPYKAVILGSAVYVGMWRKPAVKFLQKNEEALKKKKVWLFSSGPTGEGDPAALLDGWLFPKKLQETAGHIGPVEIILFHGIVIPERLTGLHRFMAEKVESPTGDYRDWDQITAWTKSIAQVLKKTPGE